ncbi:High-affinity glucose transporter [Lasiodiplodia hormozganensis]|uniref:High-affinity glucose transporter n=2 Tax=Lasiodiplodia TaxID=66739 RepID=A0A5N5CY06_9PEZI|nr:High-affinity glucose transporter [Lasiodiplodia theobromae]KAK0664163.1 High-affinity glucose transporter [Lasiodiplodia hormozganensis]
MSKNKDAEPLKASHEPSTEKIEDLADTELTTIPSNAEGHVSYGKSGIAGLVESPYVLGAAFLASMGGFSFGYDQGVISIVNVMDQFHTAFPPAKTAFGKGFMTGMLEFGAFIGCFFMPTLADMISRKRALTVVVVIFNIGAIMQTAAQSYGVLVAGRTIGGIGVGTLAMGAPIYISEIAPPNLRGTLLVLESISIVTGVVSSFWITYGTRHLPGEASFRLPFGLQMVCSTLLGIGINFYPYSPRWLALVNRPQEALRSLERLRRLPATDVRVQMEHKDILSEVEIEKLVQEKRHPGAKRLKLEVLGWFDLFRKRSWRRTAVGVGVAFFQQFSGINAFIYYAPTLFQSLGQSDEMSLIMSGIFNILQLVAVAACFVVIDKVGRRPLAILGGIGGGVAWTVMAALTGVFSKDWLANPAAGWAAVAMAFLFVLLYGVSYSPLGWCLPAEVFPNASRSKGVALSTATVWLCNFIVGVATPPMLEDLGFGTYVFFGAWCYVAAIWAYFLVPETKGKTLEQMDEVFGDYAAQEEKELMRAHMAQPNYSVKAEV